MNDFRYALTLANLIHNIDITNEGDAIEIGLIAYNLIGNKQTTLKEELILVENGIAKVPCDAVAIESITYPNLNDWNRTSNIYKLGDSNSLRVENFIEDNKNLTSPLYNKGKLVKYRQVGDIIYIDNYNGMIDILYHSQKSDSLPTLNDKEALAIADYIAYVYKYKEGLRTNNANIIQLAGLILLLWQKHCSDARTPVYLSQNDMDNILDVRYSFDRKDYGKSYKPIK